MGNYLLDTHTILWHATQNARLSAKAYDVITAADNQIFVSVVSYWEMAIKASLGKLSLPATIDEFRLSMESEGIPTLDLSSAHLREIQHLAFPTSGHRDPFDRAIVATAVVEGLVVIGRDSNFSEYGVKTLW